MTRLEWLKVFKNEQGRELRPLSWWWLLWNALDEESALIVVLSLMRQSGKTTACLTVAGHHLVDIPNALVIFVAGAEGQGQELFRRKLRGPLIAALRALDVDLKKCVFTKRSVELPNGARLEVLAPSEVSGVGRTASLLVIDEARFVEDGVLASLLPSVIATGGKVLIASSAPRLEDGGFFLGLLNAPPAEARVIRVEGTNENPYAQASQIGAVGRLLARISPSFYRREILNELVADDARSLFPLPLIERAIDPTLAEMPSSPAPAYAGVDLARRKDLASMVVVVRTEPQRPEARDHLRVASITVWDPKASPTGEVDFAQIRAAVGELPKRFPKLERIVIDEGSEGGSLLPHCRAHPGLSLRVQGFTATVDSNMAIWSSVAARLHAGTLSLPRHQRLIDELVNLRQEEIALGSRWRVVDSTKRFHRDIAVSLALAVHAAGEAGPAPCGGTWESMATEAELAAAASRTPRGFLNKIPQSIADAAARRDLPLADDEEQRGARLLRKSGWFFH